MLLFLSLVQFASIYANDPTVVPLLEEPKRLRAIPSSEDNKTDIFVIPSLDITERPPLLSCQEKIISVCPSLNSVGLNFQDSMRCVMVHFFLCYY